MIRARSGRVQIVETMHKLIFMIYFQYCSKPCIGFLYLNHCWNYCDVLVSNWLMNCLMSLWGVSNSSSASLYCTLMDLQKEDMGGLSLPAFLSLSSLQPFFLSHPYVPAHFLPFKMTMAGSPVLFSMASLVLEVVHTLISVILMSHDDLNSVVSVDRWHTQLEGEDLQGNGVATIRLSLTHTHHCLIRA